MKTQAFGATQLLVSEYGLGCARLGGIFKADSSSFERILHATRDAGINFFDTADMYSQGESERLLGRAFRRDRDKVIIASKAGYLLPAQRRLAARLKPVLRPVVKMLGLRRDKLPQAVRGTIQQDFSPKYLVRAIEGSLKRLQTDYLDLLQLHSPPLEVVRRGEWEPVLEQLKRDGKLRYYGISCDTMDVGLEALRYSGVSAVQFPVNLLEQGALEGLLPALDKQRVAGIARECLANGLLIKDATEIEMGKYTHSEDQAQQRFTQLASLRGRASEQGVPLARLAVDFVRNLPGVSVTLIGVSSMPQLQALLDIIGKNGGPPAREQVAGAP